MQPSKFIYFRKQWGEFYFVVIRFPVLSFLQISIHLTFLYAGVKVIHVLSRYAYTCILELSGFLVKSRTMSECLNLYLLEMKCP